MCINQTAALAISRSTLQSVINHRAWYDPTAAECGAGGGVGIDTGSIPEGSQSEKLAAFVDKYGQGAYDNSIKSGVPYDFTLAQAIIESGYGKSGLTQKANNFFGIKAGPNWTGDTIKMPTREENPDGSSRTELATFRAYATPQEGFADHDRFFRVNSRYAEALKYPNDPLQFLVEIKKAGYATDSSYVSTVGGVLKAVQKYIKTKNLWPPSEEVKYAIESLPSSTGGSGNSVTQTGNACGGSSGTTGKIDGLECPSGTLATINVGSTTYYKLPDAQNDEYTIYASDKRRYGKKELVCVIYTVANAYKLKYAGKSKVSVGDLNGAGHKSHKWGIAVDIDAPGTLYAADHTKGNYSSAATVDFGKLFIDTGYIKNIWWCEPSGDTSTEQIIAYAKSVGKPLNSMKCISGHENHFHVDINVPKGDEYTP